MKYKPGDWVVLGQSGNGWNKRAKGRVVKIKDIGPHLRGHLYDPNYDFYIEKHPSYEEILDLNQLMRGKGGGGDSGSIERLATAAEINNVVTDDVFKEYPLGSKVYCPRSCKVGKVSRKTAGAFFADEYPITVTFDNGERAYTTDGFMQSLFRVDHPEYKLQLYKEVPTVFGGTTPTEKKFQLNFTPTS